MLKKINLIIQESLKKVSRKLEESFYKLQESLKKASKKLEESFKKALNSLEKSLRIFQFKKHTNLFSTILKILEIAT